MKTIKLTIIGTITRDTITFPDRKRIRSFGGILYNIIPLALLAPQNLIVLPICNLGSDIYEKVLFYLTGFKNLDLSGISRVKEKNNHVHLFYNRKWDKKEILKYLVPKIEFRQVEPYLNSDCILINFISGFDIDLESLKKIRQKSKARIFIDLHSLILGMRKNGERFFKVPVYWEEYLKIADIVQMNIQEMQVLSKRKLQSKEELGNFADKILDSGPEILLVTRGREGALICYKEKRKTDFYHTASLKLTDTVDPTGCGDVFSAGFLLAYLKTNKAELSSEFANFLAGMKSTFSGVESFLEVYSRHNL
ncbi:MAG TPA: PfkB family carbohydrate kinase [candidate division Zixibacteria bacterium]